MKGIIVYSSNTGNTKRMAEVLYRELKKKYSMTLANIKENPSMEGYDFALLGSWIDKGSLDKRILQLLKDISVNTIGLYATMGTDPESDHGKRVTQGLATLLKDKKSLGQYICHGKVSEGLTQSAKSIPENVMPAEVKEQIYQAALHSREATEEELGKAAHYFLQQIEKNIE
ncbi:MAG: flavodoxin family protein [Tissierellia bacterium]|nr:flavodoxin family protein [Tissierellia bacterium]